MSRHTFLIPAFVLASAAALIGAPAAGQAQTEGPRYDTCFSLDANGRPVPILNQALICNMLEFQRQDCERLRRSVSAEEVPVLNRLHCFGYRPEDVRARPSGARTGAAGAGTGNSSGQ